VPQQAKTGDVGHRLYAVDIGERRAGEVHLAHGCKLFLTKPLGIGVLTTAEKKSLLKPEHKGLATEVRLHARALTDFREVPQQAKTGDVGHRLYAVDIGERR
jgi:selenophosphate synthase